MFGVGVNLHIYTLAQKQASNLGLHRIASLFIGRGCTVKPL